MNNLKELENKFIEIKKQGIDELKKSYFELAIFCQENLNNVGLYLRKDHFRMASNKGYYYFGGDEYELKSNYPHVEIKPFMAAYSQFCTICKSPFFPYINNEYDHLGLMFNLYADKEISFCHTELTDEFKLYKISKFKNVLEGELNQNNTSEKKLKL